MEYIVQLISNVGFPIAMCLVMVFGQKKTLDELRSTIEKNTQMIEKLSAKIDNIK